MPGTPLTDDLELALLVGGTVFLTAYTVGTLLIPLICRLSWRLGVVDKPDGLLKRHYRPTATLGGIPLSIAIISGTAILFAAGFGFERGSIKAVQLDISWGALLVAGFVIVALGTTDDIRHIQPRGKLVFQMLASSVLIGSGLMIHHVDFFGLFDFNLSGLAVPFTLFWLVGSCNAFNFIDGLDGLASGIGLIVSLVLAGLGFAGGHYGAAIMSLSLAGGLLAMLFFNVKPALIFLGDGGSQLLGLIIGALAINILTTKQGYFALPAAGIILSVPIIDTFLSILRRFSRQISPACGDRHHIHHCLQKMGLGAHGTTFVIWTIVAFSGIMGVAGLVKGGPSIAISALLFVLVELYLGIRLGCLDLRDIGNRLAGRVEKDTSFETPALSIMRAAELEILWEEMKPQFEQMKLDRAILTLEGIGADGKPNYETYQWARNETLMAELLASRWIKRFSLDGDESRTATLRLESAEQLREDENRINRLLSQIRSNMQVVTRKRKGSQQNDVELTAALESESPANPN
jgi:UDP-GlcNAc:undecaprenyl-phosphate GlcNAc-1-phosphate transferase